MAIRPRSGPASPEAGNDRVHSARIPLIGGALLTLAALLAYANSFSVPLILDDWITIQNNPQIRNLWPIWSMFTPAETTGLGGRPIANASFVLNHAATGTSLAGLHAVNLAIHVIAGLALFGIVRRTLARPELRERFGLHADWLALAVAACWLLHPLQTQSVTYISQRTESLMGMFYFLALYGFIRALEETAAPRWLLFSWVCCVAGMGSKEGMVTAPVMIFLYDHAFVARSLGEAWRRRGRYYLAMAIPWVILAILMRGLDGRGVGFGQEMSGWTYLLIECRAIVRYVLLAIWPSPLIFDYGIEFRSPGMMEYLCLLGLGVIGGGVVFALRRAPAMGFLGAWFFITLAPTSSIVPIPLQPISENRVYVPIAAVIAALVLAIYPMVKSRLVAAVGAIALGLGVLTVARNQAYRSDVSIWTDTVAKRPGSSRAHSNLGYALLNAGRLPEAKSAIETALRIRPAYADAHLNLASVLGQLGLVDEAVENGRRATQLDPRNPNAFYNLGVALAQKEDMAGAITAYESALRLRPDFAEARGNLGILLLKMGRVADAMVQCEAALRQNASLVDTRHSLAYALTLSGRWAEAAPHFQEVFRASSNQPDLLFNLGVSFQQLAHPAEAISCFEAALRLAPNHAAAREALEKLRAGTTVPAKRE